MAIGRRTWVVALSLLGSLLATAPAGAQPSASRSSAGPQEAASGGRSILEQARDLYDNAQFQAAVTLLDPAIAGGQVTGDNLNAARELRARCLVKAGHRLEAKQAFIGVLRSDAAYRPNPVQVPPDEIEVFQLALKDFQAEQVEAGKRFPASIAFSGGRGNAVNQDLADLASSAGAAASEDFSEDPEFGYSVRLPIRPRWSVDVEVTRLKATTKDRLPESLNSHAQYTASALPFVVSLVHNFSSSPARHINGFLGAGPMPSQAIIEHAKTLVDGRLIPTQIVGHATGVYFHAGAEGEWLVRPRLAITGRVLGRYASSGKLDWPRDDFEIYETWTDSKLGDRKIEFSGIAASVGVRAYIGY